MPPPLYYRRVEEPHLSTQVNGHSNYRNQRYPLLNFINHKDSAGPKFSTGTLSKLLSKTSFL